MGFHHVGQADLELLTSSDSPTSASQSAGINRCEPPNLAFDIYLACFLNFLDLWFAVFSSENSEPLLLQVFILFLSLFSSVIPIVCIQLHVNVCTLQILFKKMLFMLHELTYHLCTEAMLCNLLCTVPILVYVQQSKY